MPHDMCLVAMYDVCNNMLSVDGLLLAYAAAIACTILCLPSTHSNGKLNHAKDHETISKARMIDGR